MNLNKTKTSEYRNNNLYESIVDYCRTYIQYSNDIPKLAQNILDDINSKVINYKLKYEKIDTITRSLSNHDIINEFFMKLSDENLERYKSINWNDLLIELPEFEGHALTGSFKYKSTCSGRSPREIRHDMQVAATTNDMDTFIKCLNEILGNCCINSIDDLDDDD